MGLLDNTTQKAYYQGNDHGSYQFVSLDDIITSFMAVYVGEEKVVNKVSRMDVAFHAQRALAEMSFDTFKSIKSQQIDVPDNLVMILPHDYVNYTKVSSVDSAGIKRILYPTKHTSNPFQIKQAEDKTYEFPNQVELLSNNDFSAYDGKILSPWYNATPNGNGDTKIVTSGVLNFSHSSRRPSGFPSGSVQGTYQAINVQDIELVDLEAKAFTSAAVAGDATATAAAVIDTNNDSGLGANTEMSSTPNYVVTATNTIGAGNTQFGHTVPSVGTTVAAAIPETTVRVGLTSQDPNTFFNNSVVPGNSSVPTSNAVDPSIFDIGFVQWTAGETGPKNNFTLNVEDYDNVYLVVVSIAPFETHAFGEPRGTIFVKTAVDDISVKNSYSSDSLQPAAGKSEVSSTFESYSSHDPSENDNDDYTDDTYWPLHGERYGLSPEHAQINGSFYIDELRGKINFSSNISGKTVILDYISDSLGTDSEMQVHKFAEEAMYKSIMYGVLSIKSNTPEYVVRRYKQEKRAAIRNAKLRLSNIKLEEITQILRNSSKWIKH